MKKRFKTSGPGVLASRPACNKSLHGRIQCGDRWSGPHGNSEVFIGFLRNSGLDTPREAIGLIGSNCFSREVRTALYEIR